MKVLIIGSSIQKSQSPPWCEQTDSNADGMGLVVPWQVCLFLALSCLGEHIFIMSQLILMHYDTENFDKKSRINTNEY